MPATKSKYNDIFTGFNNFIPDFYWQVNLSPEVATWANTATFEVTGSTGVTETYPIVEMFRIHSPSEHTVDGKHMDAELRMEWHKDNCASVKECPKAALAVFFDQSAGKQDNPFLTTLFEAFDDRLKADEEVGKKIVDLNKLVTELDFSKMWLYSEGSTTTPPCDEILEVYAIPN